MQDTVTIDYLDNALYYLLDIISVLSSRFVKVWRVEAWEEDVRQTEVTEVDTLREHTDYINAAVIRDNCLYSSSGGWRHWWTPAGY